MILRAAVAALLAFMTLPTLVVIGVSFNPTAILSFPPAGFSLRWYANVLTYPQFQRAAVNSLVVTAAAVALALPAGTLAALALERGRLRGRSVWAAALLSPLVVPGVAAGSLIVFAWTLSAFPTPELLGGGRVKMIANVVKDLGLDSFNWPGAAAFAMLALALTLALLALVGRVTTERAP